MGTTRPLGNGRAQEPAHTVAVVVCGRGSGNGCRDDGMAGVCLAWLYGLVIRSTLDGWLCDGGSGMPDPYRGDWVHDRLIHAMAGW